VNAKYLLDTSVVSEPLRPIPNAKVLARLKSYQDELAIASTVWHELWFGCQRLQASAKRTAIERYLNEVISVSMAILPYNREAAEWHAAERARLVTVGKTPPFVDGQIIAVAYANNLTLVTLNPSDYAAFCGVKIEDWSRNSNR
jgi:tRNA(fMet)-specific endonuclease VapC